MKLDKKIDWFKLATVILLNFLLSIYICTTYFYIKIPMPDFKKGGTIYSFDTENRLDFSKVINIQSIFPPIVSVLPQMKKSKFCFDNENKFDIPVEESKKLDIDKSHEMRFLFIQDNVQQSLSSKIKETNCVWINNDNTTLIEAGSFQYKPPTTSSPDTSESKLYIWPGWQNVFIFTLILFLFFSISFTALRDIIYLYSK